MIRYKTFESYIPSGISLSRKSINDQIRSRIIICVNTQTIVTENLSRLCNWRWNHCCEGMKCWGVDDFGPADMHLELINVSSSIIDKYR